MKGVPTALPPLVLVVQCLSHRDVVPRLALVHVCDPRAGVWQRMECIASTYPVFDDRRCEEGWDCKAVFSSSCTCCMQELTPPQALHLLNGTHVVFVGDSTARRASRQLRCFLDGSRFVDTSDHRTSHGYVEDRSRGVAVNITSYWVPDLLYR